MGDALFYIDLVRKKVIHIEIKIPKEIRAHRETIFFGLSARQFICAVLAVGLAAGIYLGLGNVIGKQAASWLCLLVAAPVAIAGFFHYNGMTRYPNELTVEEHHAKQAIAFAELILNWTASALR